MQIRERSIPVSSGDTSLIVAAAPNYIVRVIHVALTVDVSDVVRFIDTDGTPLTPFMSFAAKGQWLDRCIRPNGGLFATAPGKGLQVNVGNTANVCGYVVVQLLPVTP